MNQEYHVKGMFVGVVVGIPVNYYYNFNQFGQTVHLCSIMFGYALGILINKKIKN